MLKSLVLFLPFLLSAASPADWTISFDSGRFDTQVTADRQGNLIQARLATDCTLPTVNSISPCGPLWIAKLDATGQKVIFATYLGDPAAGAASGVFLKSLQTDRDGNIVLLASAGSSTLPTAAALQTTAKGVFNLYVCKLSADGSQLLYATYLGGSGNDTAQSLAIDARGAAWMLAFTSSPDFPATPGAPASRASGRAAIVRLSPEGALEYSATIDYGLIDPDLKIDATGAANLIVNNELLRFLPDGGAIQRVGTRLPALASWPLFFPTPAGGLWLAGSVFNGLIAVTADAAQAVSGPSPVLRINGGMVMPPDSALAAHQVRAFATDPADRSRIFATTDGGVFLSEDNGANWARVFDASALTVTVDPFDSNVVYLGLSQTFPASAAIFRSTDRGHTFAPLAGEGLDSAVPITSIAADTKVPGRLYAAGRAFYRSEDGGQHWRPYFFPGEPNPSPSASLFTTPVSVRVDPTVPDRVYVLTTSQCIGFCPVIANIYRSNDAGLTLNRMPLSLGSGTLGEFAVDGNSADVFLLINGKLLAWRGGSFDQTETLDVTGATALALDFDHPGTLYAGASDGSILRSGDGGATWMKTAQTPQPATRLAVSASGALLAAQPADSTDAFALHYDSTGNLLYGTYLGGGATNLKAAALTPNGHLFLAGTTGPGLPIVNAFQSVFGGGKSDGFLAEFDSAGALLSATYFGGTGDEEIDSIIALDDGSVIVIGTTTSSDFPGLIPSPFGGGRTFAARIQGAR